MNGYDVICTSGQEVEDMIKYTDKEDGLDLRMDIVEMLLKSGHLAPTCPDTLWTLPFPPGQDPFVIERVPDLVVIGNQKFGGSKVLDMNGEKCLVVLVEEFATGGLVVVDCLDLAVDVVGFSNTVEE